MTIKAYANALSEKPDATEEFEGNLSELLKKHGIQYKYKEPQQVSFWVNGECVDALDWSKVYVNSGDDVILRVIPHGKIFSKVIGFVSKIFSWLMPKQKAPQVYNQPQKQDTPKGSQLAASNAQANTAKLNQTVPEIAGRFLRVPEHLVPPRKYFFNPRTLYQEMFLCIGVGEYDFDPSLVKIGTTPIANLDGAEYHIYPPGADVSEHGMHQNWYSCPEVGSTGAGGAGLELTSSASSNLDPIAPSYLFNGYTMTASPIPSGWTVGTKMKIRITRPYDTVDDGIYSSIEGNFIDIAHLSIGDEVASRLGDKLKIIEIDLDANFDGYAKFDYLNEFDVWVPVKVSEATDIGYWFADDAIDLSITTISGSTVTYKAIKEEIDFTGWNGFGSITSLPQNVYFNVEGSDVVGEWAGPFNACPISERTLKVEYDVFFPRGLGGVNDQGGLYNYSVTVEAQWRVVGGAWQSIIKTYSNSTLDQIGYTETIDIPTESPVEVRMRRVGTVSTSTQIYDEVEWYGLRSLLATPTSYPNWTTIGVRFKGLGKIGSGSENKINLIVTRKLPTLQSNATLGPVVTTREISAFAIHIANSVGYTLSDWDLYALTDLNNVWKARGETLDFVFNETTVERAMQLAFGAGMSELTIDDGLLKPVREGVRTQYEQAYSAQNTTDGFNRQFTLDRVDANDGVLVEYIDAQDGYSQKTVECKLPGKAGVRLQRLKVDGVVGRDRAWRIGMRQARALEYQKWAYRFATELDAMNSSYGSYVALIPDIANYGRSGLVLSVDGNVWEVGEPLEFEDGKSYVIAWRDDKGKFIGPFPVLPGFDAYHVEVDASYHPSVKIDRELPHFFFGELSNLTLPAIVTQISPSSEGRCSVRAVNYDARIYADDNSLAPQENVNG